MKICIHTAEIRISSTDRRMVASFQKHEVWDQMQKWRREFRRPVRMESAVVEVDRPPYE